MTHQEEQHIINSINDINRKVTENNIVLKQLLNYITAKDNPNVLLQYDIKDFAINVIANLISERRF